MKILTGIWKFVNSKIFLLALSILLVAFSSTIVNWWLAAKADASRWEDNYNIRNGEVEVVNTRNGKLVLKVEVLEFTVGELKRSKDSIVSGMLKELQNQKITLRQVEHLLTINQQYSKDLQTELINRDTLIRYLQLPIEVASNLPALPVGKYEDANTKAEMFYHANKWILKYTATNKLFGVLYHQRDPVDLLLFKLRIGEKRYWFNFEETNKNIKTEVEIINIERGKR